jgi:hypothetical protein
VEAVGREHRPGAGAEIPARASDVVEIYVQAAARTSTAATRRALQRDRHAQRHHQIELRIAIRRTPQVHFERRAELERRLQVRHAAARGVVLAAHRNRRTDAQIELDILAIEQLAAQPVAIRLEERAAIDEIRHGHRVDARFVRAAIVRECDAPAPSPNSQSGFSSARAAGASECETTLQMSSARISQQRLDVLRESLRLVRGA